MRYSASRNAVMPSIPLPASRGVPPGGWQVSVGAGGRAWPCCNEGGGGSEGDEVHERDGSWGCATSLPRSVSCAGSVCSVRALRGEDERA